MKLNSAPRPSATGFRMRVLPNRDCLEEAIARNGFCSPKDCWHFVAINKIADEWEPGAKHHVRVDAGHVKLNYRGWRYIADTPRHVKRSLMLFDLKRYEEVHVREYTLRFHRSTKVKPFTKERREQINQARDRRRIEGRELPAPSTAARGLRQRVEGFSVIV